MEKDILIRHKLVVLFLTGVCLFSPTGCTAEPELDLKYGDLIFQVSKSFQSKALQGATRSIWTHMGIIYFENGNPYVYEAAGKVQLTPLETWIEKGKGKKYVVKRLKNAEKILRPKVLKEMKAEGQRFKGKSYDKYFAWSDERIYCSELVYKIYKRGSGIEIGRLQKLKKFDLSGKKVQALMKKRYGDKIPYDETVISPVSMFTDEKLMTVFNNP